MRFLWGFELDAVAVLIPAVAVLFALGGSGVKAIRRFGIPTLIGASALSLDHSLLECVISSVVLMALLVAPYGDKVHGYLKDNYYGYLYVLGLGWGIALLPLNHGADPCWVFAPCFTFGSLTIMSQELKFPTWKWVEMATGASIGLVAYKFLAGG